MHKKESRELEGFKLTKKNAKSKAIAAAWKTNAIASTKTYKRFII